MTGMYAAPSFSEDHGGFVELHCPQCDFEYLHHTTVTVFDREEDQEAGLRVVVGRGGRVKVDGDLKGNPSSRRHGIAIEMWCEGCGSQSVLHIAQHKGNMQFRTLVAEVGGDDSIGLDELNARPI